MNVYAYVRVSGCVYACVWVYVSVSVCMREFVIACEFVYVVLSVYVGVVVVYRIDCHVSHVMRVLYFHLDRHFLKKS